MKHSEHECTAECHKVTDDGFRDALAAFSAQILYMSAMGVVQPIDVYLALRVLTVNFENKAKGSLREAMQSLDVGLYEKIIEAERVVTRGKAASA